MNGFFEFLKIISLLVALGAACWAGFSVLAGSSEVGDTSFDTAGSLRTCGIVFAIAVAINMVAARLSRDSN